MTKTAVSGFRLWLRVALMWVVFVVVLFAPAGTLRWPEAWLFLGVYLAWAIPVVSWLQKNSPDLLAERMRGGFRKEQKGWDKVLGVGFLVLFVALDVVLGFDAVRFGWSRVPLALKALGFVALAPSLWLCFLTMRENPYLSTVVWIQEERGHRVVATGPYAQVRHPMYVGVVVLLLAMPLCLGSLWALVPAVLMVLLLLLRTHLEDRTLHDELPGYREYAEEVRYRLLPRVW